MVFESSYAVRFDDVDGAGIVYYPRYFHFCHKSFEDFFNEHGDVSYPTMINDLGLGFPTVNIKADFYKPFFYGDIIISKFAVLGIGKSSVQCNYKFFNAKNDEISFSAQVVVVCMDLAKRQAVAVPASLRAALEKIKVGCE